MSAQDHLRAWLAEGMTGCQFARLIAQDKERIVQASFPQLAPETDVTRVFEAGASLRLPAIAIFSWIRTEGQLVQQLRVLAEGARWRLTEEHPEGLVTDDILIGVEWTIRDGLASSMMGLAPFATMPVTRRAPYVCIAAWPGGHDNPHWKRYDQGIVHFLDTDLGGLRLSKAKYRSLTDRSKSETHALLSELEDDARHYRRAAFRLQAAVAPDLRGFVVR